MFKKLICKLFGHQFKFYPTNNAKHHCERCGLVQWVMEDRFPEIGKPKYIWKDMFYDND